MRRKRGDDGTKEVEKERARGREQMCMCGSVCDRDVYFIVII